MVISRQQDYEIRMTTGPHAFALLTVAEMSRADRLAVEAGTPGVALMAAAGAAVADTVRRRFPPGPASVLCGPGNNGGDGFVAARLPREAGWTAPLALLRAARRSAVTVPFFRKKPGHVLLPGRLLCGDLVVADIGIPAAVLDVIAPRCHENDPALWLDRFPWPRPDGHKYSRGHAVVVGGGVMTGAGRLAARGGARARARLADGRAPAAPVPVLALPLHPRVIAP